MESSVQMRAALIEVYSRHGAALAKALHTLAPSRKLSLPLLIDPSVGEYASQRPRWLAVGQETNGWGKWELASSVDLWITKAFTQYKKFQLGRNYIRSPFWCANYTISGWSRNGGNPNFLWTNLVRFDENGHRPSEELEEASFQTFNVLAKEVEILEPDAVIFFVGPRYEVRLNQAFRGIQYEQLRGFESELVYRCKHPSLPLKSYWTYHPNYLRRSRNWLIIEKLAQLIESES